MIDRNVDASVQPASMPLVSDQPQMMPKRVQAFCYCAECGSWDAHGLECLCCGYDFHYTPRQPSQPIG